MPTKKLKKLVFLIHGLCYAEMLFGEAMDSEPRVRFKPYSDREDKCIEGWRTRIDGFLPEEALVIIPAANANGRPAGDFNARAQTALGDRCFILECPDGSQPDFWSSEDDEFRQAILNELQGAFVQQNLTCNKEEFDTDLHCLACCHRLKAQLKERGYEINPATLATEAWGASFDGCVTKYSITLRRMLGLVQPTENNFGLTVPDAAFLLDIGEARCLSLQNGLQLFIFEKGDELIALYTLASHSLSDRPAFVRLPPGLSGVVVRSKQGTRLWPNPETYQVPGAPPEYLEPAQQLVQFKGDRLSLPASTGFVYRLAKAPAYVFAPPGMAEDAFSTLLEQAEIELN